MSYEQAVRERTKNPVVGFEASLDQAIEKKRGIVAKSESFERFGFTEEMKQVAAEMDSNGMGLEPAIWAAWFRNAVIKVKEDIVEVYMPTRFSRQYVEQHFESLFRRHFSRSIKFIHSRKLEAHMKGLD